MSQQTLIHSLRQALQGNHDLAAELIAALLVDVGYLPTVRWFEQAGYSLLRSAGVLLWQPLRAPIRQR